MFPSRIGHLDMRLKRLNRKLLPSSSQRGRVRRLYGVTAFESYERERAKTSEWKAPWKEKGINVDPRVERGSPIRRHGVGTFTWKIDVKSIPRHTRSLAKTTGAEFAGALSPTDVYI